jgi:hypothetical protein
LTLDTDASFQRAIFGCAAFRSIHDIASLGARSVANVAITDGPAFRGIDVRAIPHTRSGVHEAMGRRSAFRVETHRTHSAALVDANRSAHVAIRSVLARRRFHTAANRYASFVTHVTRCRRTAFRCVHYIAILHASSVAHVAIWSRDALMVGYAAAAVHASRAVHVAMCSHPALCSVQDLAFLRTRPVE